MFKANSLFIVNKTLALNTNFILHLILKVLIWETYFLSVFIPYESVLNWQNKVNVIVGFLY
jgi:hypothetical protein